MVRFMFREQAMIAHLQKANASRPRASRSRFRNIVRPIWLITCVVVLDPFACKAASSKVEPPPPSTPREFFNAGARQLGERKLREAEVFFESALASQEAALQPSALYNLGHVRFGQGAEELKKGPANRPTAASAQKAEQNVTDAIRNADEALAGEDLQKLVEAYIRGRGARKDAKAATQAVARALEAHRVALTKWERASGDFKSSLELNTSDSDARHNADVVDRCIAKLVDSLREMQKCSGVLCEKNSALGEKLKQLKGRIPANQMPPGAAGDDDEEEDQLPFGREQEQKEGPSRDGKEMPLSAEQAGWLLEGFKLDSERRLPMGQGAAGQPKDRARPTW
jgi:hypothetical protein